ncbi:MAG: BTAD domain-containing putative transcriptional regulator [Alphaproteobacteria bacterium]|nr:BTAD domain-containing putative transcriptional regulator [Alphaproteobacteria bacterium]
MLALLALCSPAPLPRDRLCALLWSRRPEAQARASLRQSLHELNAALGPAVPLLVAQREQIALRGAGLEVMLEPVEGTAQLLEELDGIDPALDRFLDERRTQYRQAALARVEAVLAGRQVPQERLEAAEAVLALEPGHEIAWRAAIMARAEMGARAEALATYDRCVATLAGRFGAAPSIETQALAAALRRGACAASGPVAATRAATRAATQAATRAGVRVGVAPLRAVAGGARLSGLSLGLAEEITTALARFRWLFLIATPSMAAVARGAGAAAWRDLALDFLLDGTLQQSGTRIRVSLRLLDMRAEAERGALGEGGQPAGEVVWSARYERDAEDLLTLQDEIAAEAVAQIDPQLIQHESRRAGQRSRAGGTNPTAYDLMLRAIPALYQLEEQAFLAAGHGLERAVALDPGSAAAHAWLAYWHIFLVGQGWNAAAEPPLARDAAMARAGTLAERAVRLDPADARALTIAGHVRAFLHRDVHGAMELHDRALGLNPNLPLAWAFSGLAESYRGRHEEAIRRIAQARRLSPFDPNAFFYDTALMVPHLMLRRFGPVVEMGRRAVALNPTLSSTYKLLLSALGHLGEAAEAASVRERLYRLEPGYSLTQAAARSTFQRREDDGIFLEGLRLAGLPT